MPLRKRSDIDDLLKMGAVSLAIHIFFVILLSLNPWPLIVKAQPIAYTVTLMPVVLPEPETQIKEHTSSPLQEGIPKPIEKTKPIAKPKKDDIVEKIKKPSKERKADLKHLEEAREEIHKKVALEEIQKRVAHREKAEERPKAPPSNVPVVSSSKTSPELEFRLSQYYSMIWSKVKKAWTIPENLLKERVDLETIIVVIIEGDGKIQRYWFEKKSGNDLYDQTAIRAIKKAEPLPPIPTEIGDSTLEVGIRFRPE